MKNKKLIFILIDSMSIKDFYFIKNNKEIFPNFNNLFDRSVCFENLYSVANPTEFVLPSIFSSSLPLNSKTCEYGIQDRDLDLLEDLISKKFKVNMFTNVAVCNDIYGYSDDKFSVTNYASIQIIWTHFIRNYLWHLDNNDVYKDNEIKINKFAEIVERFFPYFISHLNNDYSNYTKFVLGGKLIFKKKLLIQELERHLVLFRLSPKSYYEKYFELMLKNSFFSYFGINSIKEKIIIYLSNFLKNTNQNWKDGRLNLFNYEISFNNIFSDCSYIFNKAIKDINKNETNSFNYIHIMDLHNTKIGKNKFINKINKSFVLNNKNKLSLKYIDNELGIFINKLNNNNYSICITSDHGTIDKNNKGPLTTNETEGIFHDDFLRIPLAISNNNKTPIDNKKIYSSIHILPLFLKLSDVHINKSFNLDENFILCEHCHRGPTSNNLLSGIFYLCLITKKFKIIYKNEISKFDQSPLFKEKIIYNKDTNIDISKYLSILNKRKNELLSFKLREKK